MTGEAESRTRTRCSLPDPSSSAGIKWIERTLVSDGTPPLERHSICYEVGVLMKCRELLFLFSPFFSSFLFQALQGRPSVCFTWNGWKEPIEFYTPLVMINVLGVGRVGSETQLPLAGAQAPPWLCPDNFAEGLLCGGGGRVTVKAGQFCSRNRLSHSPQPL